MLKVGEQLSHYKILSAIGAGGMGEVFLAEDARLHRRVALKILPEDFAQDAMRMRRFIQEAKATSVLNHPNIITIHEIGETDSKHFIVTEYIEGETLRERISKNSFALDDILNVGIQVASALQTAHSAQIVHRDIKPENVMIRPDGLIKILDFGIAKLIEKKVEPIDEGAATLATKAQTLAGMIIGTAAYMSPEQAQGKEIDSRSDIFSFGVVLYEMITGKQPFAGENAMDVIARVLHKEPIPLNQLHPRIPSELERIINKTLSKDRNERYQTVDDLLNDLKNIKEELQFQSKLELSLPPNKQAEDNTQIIEAKVTEETSSLAPNNLTENPVPIVGREKEIAEVKNLLLQNNVRLVTMTGIGGTGKTTLAKAVARELLTEFSDGVYFAELAAVTNAESVVSTVAQQLGVKEAGGKPILETLKDYLRERQMLIVVDNFEQVTDAATQISELLSAANRLKILITSRALLHLSFEYEFVVPPLAVPSNIKSVSLAELSEYEAIKLFVERARNAKANFALTEENAKSVAEICARLDGLPLAIELGAARVKILSPQAILSKLQNRLKLLTGGAKDLPARQQTMRGAVGWSYDLLTADEKLLFNRLAVFAGGFTFEAAEAVCANFDSDKEYLEVLDLITSLVDKSLLVAKEQASGDLRFRMLEVVREYALESLEASGDAEEMRRRHAACYLALGEEAEPHLQASQSAEWLDRLEDEHDNLREALAWFLENDSPTAARLAAAIRGFWTYHSHLTEGRRWLEAVLEERGGSLAVPAAVRFKLLNSMAVNARLQGDYETARKAYEKGLAAGSEENNLRQIALSSRGLGAVFYQQGDFTAAQKFFEEGLAMSRQLNDESGIAYSLAYLGELARTTGDNAAARPLLEVSLAICRQLVNKQLISENLVGLGFVDYGEGDYEAARSRFAEGLTIARELGDRALICCCLDGFAALAAVRGELQQAIRRAGLAKQLCESIGYEMEPAERRFRDAYTADLKTKMDETDFTNFYEQGRKLKLEEAVALCLEEINS